MNIQPTILSGASKGFDQMVAHLCVKYNHKHLICIPPCDPQVKQFVPLTQAQLNVGMYNVLDWSWDVSCPDQTL